MIDMVEVGQKAPGFTLVNQNREKVRLSDYEGKITVLAFYPGAFTSGCTQEMCTLRDQIAEFEDLNARVLGISVNDPFANKAFHEENDLNFPLLSDYTREVVKKYGVYHENFASLEGYVSAKRSVFILNKDGKIVYKWVTEDPGVMPPFEEIKQKIAELD